MTWWESVIALLKGTLGDGDAFSRLMRLITLILGFLLAVVVITAVVIIIRADVIAQIVDTPPAPRR